MSLVDDLRPVSNTLNEISGVGVALNLLRVGVGGDGEGIKSIVDARGVYGGFLARCV
jgi:hypothetical protein